MNMNSPFKKQTSIKCVQVNLHHAKGATAVLCKRFIESKLDIALIQEPWAHGSRILGIPTTSSKLIYDETQPTPRAAILVNGTVKFVPITEFIRRDIVAIMMEVPTTRGKTEIYVASAYFPGDVGDVPPPEVAAFVSYCKKQNKSFIIGCDANAHHTIWASTDTNSRGTDLLEYISNNEIDICNRGDAPTFMNAVRQEVLDLTLSSPIISDNIKNWHVSDEISLSDHKHILFEYEAGQQLKQTIRDPRKTNWELYNSELAKGANTLAISSNTCEKLEESAEQLSSLIKNAFNLSCTAKERSSNRDVPWWNNKLEKLRKKTRKLFNRAKRTQQWDEYKESLTAYNKEIRRSKRIHWRHTCENIENTPATARLQKILAKDHSNGLGTLKKEDGSFTTSTNETLELMMKTHFPCSIISSREVSDQTTPALCTGISETRTDNHEIMGEMTGVENTRVNAGSLANEIFTESKVEWAIDSFEPFKSPGRDGIFPVLLQKGKAVLTPILTKLFQASLSLGYIPAAWRQVRVTFIPKANKKDKTSPKSFRPISLSSVLLKTMEKIIDEHIKSSYLAKTPLSKYQFAYQEGKSSVTALHAFVTKVEKSLEAKEISLAAFLDIEGAFDNSSHGSMVTAMTKRGFDKCIIHWISEMLSKREISATLGSSTINVRAIKGCPQGGVLSPLLWSLIVDDLLKHLIAQGFEIIAFADDIVIIVRGKYDSVIANRMQIALNLVSAWCDKEGLNINPSKTTIVPFTRKRKISFNNIKLKGTFLELSNTVKYLGVYLDSKLNWNKHLEQAINKATNALWICKRTFGKQWGLKPKMIHWIYSAIVRPRLTYGSLVWWPKTKEKGAQRKLEKLQRLATLSITGAMRSTPSKALDALLYMLPLHQFVQLEAEKSALRIKRSVNLFEGDLTGHLSILKTVSINPLVINNEDWMERKYNFNRRFRVFHPDRDAWECGGPELRAGSIVFYTDGSKMNDQVGAGVIGPGIDISIPMGKWPTVFQAEIQAILECSTICLRRNYRHSNICIMSDSQAALNALKSATCTSKHVWEGVQSLQKLACRNQVNLYWVPGHCGIDGNERADALARLGSSHQFIGPEPFCGLSSSSLRRELKAWESTKVESNWNNTFNARQSKRFITPNASMTRKILELSKKDLSIYTGLVTGHCPSRYHLKVMGKLQDDMCRFCGTEKEDSEHLLCRCAAIVSKRCKFFDKGLIEPFDIWRATPSAVVRFIRSVIPCWCNAIGQTVTTTSNSGTSF